MYIEGKVGGQKQAGPCHRSLVVVVGPPCCWLMVVCWCQCGGRAVVGHHGRHCWCGGGWQKETTSHSVWLVVCLVTGVKQTNNWIPLHSISANSVEHSSLNSRMPKFHWNKRHWNEKNSRPSCQILFHWILPDSTGMTGFPQELGGHW